MQTGLTFNATLALFGAMTVLALTPSISVLAVTTRSAASGFFHGACTAAGIVTGDIIYILVAILGLSMLAEAMDRLFVVIQYAGGAYLIWLGVALWRTKAQTTVSRKVSDASVFSSYLTGLLLTLADQKAILFYLGFFPAFLQLSAVTSTDTAIIIAVTLVAVGLPKLFYAYMADRAGNLVKPGISRFINRLAGGIMIAIGVFLFVKG